MTAAEQLGVVGTGRVVAQLGLVTAFGHVSRRLSDHAYEITTAGDLGALPDHGSVVVDSRAGELPRGAPGEAWLHGAVYRARPDVGAIVRAQPLSTFAAASATDELVPLHGQAAWLGPVVPVHPVQRLLRTPDLAADAADSLGMAGALLLRANGAVAVGRDLPTAASRMWLLAAACDVWLRATAAGQPRGLDPEDVIAWERAGTALLPRLWEHLVRTAGTRAGLG